MWVILVPSETSRYVHLRVQPAQADRPIKFRSDLSLGTADIPAQRTSNGRGTTPKQSPDVATMAEI